LTKLGHLALKIVIKKGKILKIKPQTAITRHHAFVACSVLHNFKGTTINSVAGGKWGHAPLGAGLMAHQHTLFRHLKNAFSAEIWAKNMLKNAYFLK